MNQQTLSNILRDLSEHSGLSARKARFYLAVIPRSISNVAETTEDPSSNDFVQNKIDSSSEKKIKPSSVTYPSRSRFFKGTFDVVFCKNFTASVQDVKHFHSRASFGRSSKPATESREKHQINLLSRSLDKLKKKDPAEILIEGAAEAEKNGQGFAYILGVLASERKKTRVKSGVEFISELFQPIKHLILFGFASYLAYRMYVISSSETKSNSIITSIEGGEDVNSDQSGKPSFKKTYFSEIIGCDDVKDELSDIISYLKNPQMTSRLGGHVPKGVLLTGPPGVGKTLLARGVATEADVPFFYTSGSQFDEVFVGVGANRVKELFNKARDHAPCVVFIDEIDAIGGERKEYGGSLSRQTINQLLAEMDGFLENNGIVVIAATNFGSILDPALTRAGRFDFKIGVTLPDVKGRTQLLEFYLSKVKFDPNIDTKKLATVLYSYSGAAIENLVNQAALRASNTGATMVRIEHLDWAKDKIQMGRERSTKHILPEVMKNTAYHEAAHTLVAYHLKLPVYSVTIQPRGNTAGHMSHFIDENYRTKDQLVAYLAVALAGKLGEEVVEGKNKHTTGCSSDYRSASKMAERIVTEGLGSKLYHCYARDCSFEMLREYESEKKALLDKANKTAEDILKKYATQHRRLSEELLKKEILTANEVKKILA